MIRISLAIALLFLTVPAFGQIRFEQDVNCTPQGGALQTEVGRGCLLVEASMPAFVDLRDELTAGMPDAGGGNVTMTCDACSVAKGITGCTAEGDEVVLTRRRAAVHRIACILTSHRAQKLIREAVETAKAGVDPSGDIGDGDPG